MQLLSITEFIGRFHPVLVHLPIGILLFAIVLLWLSRSKKFADQQKAIFWALLLGAASAVLSCISGWMLSSSGEYDETTLGLHQWMGIGTAFISLIALFYFNKEKQHGQRPGASLISSSVLLLSIVITGHLGGTLTHGEGYLTQGFYSGEADSSQFGFRKPIANVQEAQAYQDVVAPIFQSKCSGCHGSKKQKGGLRLDGKDWILKGGKDGQVLNLADPDKSEFYKRVMLDPLEEHHMPPKGKPQLSEKDIALLHWWLQGGASFDKKVKEIQQPDKIKPLLTSLQSDQPLGPKRPVDVPDQPVEAARPSVLFALQQKGVVVLPVARDNNYLMANFAYAPTIGSAELKLLDSLSNQLVWLKLGNTSISDSAMHWVGGLKNLTRLSLENTGISDAGLNALKSLINLQWLNLKGTRVSAKGIMQLDSLHKLTEIYCYQTKVTPADWQPLSKAFKQARIDTGGYSVPTLESDTSILRIKDLKKVK